MRKIVIVIVTFMLLISGCTTPEVQSRDENIEYCIDILCYRTDLTPVQMTAVLSFVGVKSDFSPTYMSGAGFGLCQWTYKRFENLEAFASGYGDINSLEVQLQFLIEELSPKSNYYALEDFGLYTVDDWIQTTDLEKSVIIFRNVYASLYDETSIELEEQLDLASQLYPTVLQSY